MAGKLKYAPEVYQPTYKFLKEAFGSEKALRQEYTRLRDIAQKRLGRMARTEFARSQTFQQNVGQFPTLSTFKGDKGKISKRSQFARKLAQLARFVESPTSTTAGQKKIRKQTIKSLHERGYDFVDESNYWDFFDYMEEARARKLDRTYDSDRIAKTYKAAKRKKVDPHKVLEDFDKYARNKKALNDLKRPKEKGGKTSEELEEALNV